MKLLLIMLPKRTLTAFVGRIADLPLSRLLIPAYARFYSIDLTTTELPLREYSTLSSFFARKLRPGARVISEGMIVAPVDGLVQECGSIGSGDLLQAKGCPYTLDSLLGSQEDAARFLQGKYMTLYLSPTDYHRIHMPTCGRLMRWRYIPGSLFPVNPKAAHSIAGLFTKNERLVTFATVKSGEMAMVKVGATIVGSIRTSYLPVLRPWNKRRRVLQQGSLDIPLEQGEEVGYFTLGSTVILLFSHSSSVEWMRKAGDTVQMGQAIAKFV